MKIEDKNDRDIVFFAFRYALNRSTSAVSTVIDKIKENWCDFPLHDKEQFVSEIERERGLNYGNTLNSSQKYAIDEWDNFKLWAEGKIREEKIDTVID